MQNTIPKVFKEEAYDELRSNLNALAAAKRPLVVNQELDVLENKFNGVKGGYRVKVLWFFSGTPLPEWKAALPDETRTLLGTDQKTQNGDDVGTYANPVDINSEYPFESPTYPAWTTRLLSLHAQNAAYNLENAVGHQYGGNALDNFFGAATTVEPTKAVSTRKTL